MAKINVPLNTPSGAADGGDEHVKSMGDRAAADSTKVTVTDKNLDQTVTRAASETTEAAAEADAPVRPEGVPEKFWNAETGEVNTEALLASYKELESNRSKPPADDTDTSSDTDDTPKAATTDITAAASAEFQANGELSDDTYTKLDQAGFSRAMVDQYIAGNQAIVAERTKTVMKKANATQAEFDQAAEWAAENLPADEQERINSALSQSEGSAVLAVKDLIRTYKEKADSEPGVVVSGSASSGGLTPLRSQAEIKAAMNDPRYKNDAAYRGDVMRRIALAEKSGLNPYAA